MSIKKFEQFISESIESIDRKNKLSNNEVVNNTYSKLISYSREKIEEYISNLNMELLLVDNVIEVVKKKYEEHIIGEPEVDINRINNGYDNDGMSGISFIFNTDIESVYRDDYQDDIDKLKKEIEDIIYDFSLEHFGGERRTDRWVRITFIDTGREDDEPMDLEVEVSIVNAKGLVDLCMSSVDDSYDKIERMNKYIFGK
jgi:hypothetical protein